jgi:prepilin-type N-terminal cleavage/methylation domain-containing protein
MKRGFSLVEILVSVSVFGIFVVLFFTFFETNRNSYEKVVSNNKAIQFAKEGIEAVRNIRDKNFTDLSNGTWGLSTTTNKWQLSGVSNIDENFIREILISEIDPQTKKVESKVSYNLFGLTSTVSLISYLTYWQEFYTNIGDWTTILKDSFLSLTGGLKVALSGDYAYVITATTLRVYDISNPSSPVFMNSYPQTGNLNNVFVSGNYVYMTSTNNSAELQIRNISNPNSLGTSLNSNLPGNHDANGIFVTGNYAYITRSSGNPNFIVYNISSLPTVTQAGSINVSGENFYEVYVNGIYSYVTSSGDTTELRVMNNSNWPTITSIAINLTGGTGGAVTTDNAGAISGESNYLYIAQGSTNSTVHLFDISIANTPTQISRINFTGGNINDISVGNGGQYAWLGTNLPNQELTIVEGSISPVSFTTFGTYNATTSQSFLGVSYSSLKDRLVAVSNYVTEGLIILKPN